MVRVTLWNVLNIFMVFRKLNYSYKQLQQQKQLRGVRHVTKSSVIAVDPKIHMIIGNIINLNIK